MVLSSTVVCPYSIEKRKMFQDPRQKRERGGGGRIVAILRLKPHEKFYKHMKYSFPKPYDSISRKMKRKKYRRFKRLAETEKKMVKDLYWV